MLKDVRCQGYGSFKRKLNTPNSEIPDVRYKSNGKPKTNHVLVRLEIPGTSHQTSFSPQSLLPS